jgi:hypothetical protein
MQVRAPEEHKQHLPLRRPTVFLLFWSSLPALRVAECIKQQE